jgi:integration host factor subunit beta
MLRTELVEKVAASNETLSRKDVEQAVSVFFEEIITCLENGARVEIRGFGSFEARPRKARLTVSPLIAEPVMIAARRLPRFRPGKLLAARVDTV